MSHRRADLQIRAIEIVQRSDLDGLDPVNMAGLRERSLQLLEEVEPDARSHPELAARVDRLRSELAGERR